jgi:hypothetical protein
LQGIAFVSIFLYKQLKTLSFVNLEKQPLRVNLKVLSLLPAPIHKKARNIPNFTEKDKLNSNNMELRRIAAFCNPRGRLPKPAIKRI